MKDLRNGAPLKTIKRVSNLVMGLAVDWLAGNIYWTDALYRWIGVARIEQNTNFSRVLVSTGLDTPHGIAVHPYKG